MRKSTSEGSEQSSQLHCNASNVTTSTSDPDSSSVRQRRGVCVDEKSTYCIEDRQLIARPRAHSAPSSSQHSALGRLYSVTIEWPLGVLVGTLGYIPVLGPLLRRSMQLCSSTPRDEREHVNANCSHCHSNSLPRKSMAIQYRDVPSRRPGDVHFPYEPPAPPVEQPVDFLLDVPCRTRFTLLLLLLPLYL